MAYLLELKGICKQFPGVKALDDVSFNLLPGEVHVLMGENGAGKSTLMKIIDGLYKADGGEMLMSGKPIQNHSPKEAQERGISMIHQELNTVTAMTVAENIYLGREPAKMGVLDKKKMNENASGVLATLGLNISPTAKMGQLSVAQMQMVEIAKAISYNAQIVIMDEPTSAISEKEVDALFQIIELLKQKGVGIIYISHKMNEVFRIAQRITVLRDGKTVGTEQAQALTNDKLISLMVGRELSNMYPPHGDGIPGDTILSVNDLSSDGAFKDVSFSLKRGEVLGVSGLMGAGRSELLEAIFGLRKCSGGCIEINGRTVRIAKPKDAIGHKIAFVTEDRKRTGLNLKFSVKHDMSIVTLKKYCKLSQVVNTKSENAAVDDGIKQLNVKTPTRNQLITNLSGGNQQKVILARWLLAQPDIFMLDEPTRGIDVGAKYEIYSIIRDLASSGKAVLLVSSEMPEIIGVCDRVIVMHEGRLTGELDREDMTQEAIMQYATGMEVKG